MGDVFLVEANPLMSPVTNFFQRWWSKDDTSVFGHSGIIIDDKGSTFEARWKVESNSLFKKYGGKNILIVRIAKFDPYRFLDAMSSLEPHRGEWFPFMRMVLHALRIAKFIHWSKLVCSELVAKYLFYMGTRHHHYFGANVDDLEEELRNWKDYSIVFDGILPVIEEI
jgi:hypothetical protein